MFQIIFTESALDDLRFLRKADQTTVRDEIQRQLPSDPLTQTRHRKPLRPNDLSTWQLRIGDFRVFFDLDEPQQEVIIKAIGWKEHNKLLIRGQEYQL